METAIAAHPSVVECAVAPVPDDDLGEEIKAYVVVGPDTEPDAAGLAGFLHGRLASFKIPRYWEFRDSLPHTPSERIAKSRLEEGRADWRADTVDLRPERSRVLPDMGKEQGSAPGHRPSHVSEEVR